MNFEGAMGAARPMAIARSAVQQVQAFTDTVYASPASGAWSSRHHGTVNILEREAIASTSEPWQRARRVQEFHDAGEEIDYSNMSRYQVLKVKTLRLLRRIWIGFLSSPMFWVLIVILGLVASVIACIVDVSVVNILRWRRDVSFHDGGFTDWLIWVSTAASSALIATLAPLIFISSANINMSGVEGSGIPHIRAILSGTIDVNKAAIGVRVMIGKLIGLTFAQSTGLLVGREGPFVHAASCLTAMLWKLPLFTSVANSDSSKRIAITAAVAVGVTAVFGTPLGGVLFAVETTSSWISIPGVWAACVGAIVCRLGFDILNGIRGGDSNFLELTTMPPFSVSPQIIAYVALGLFCGMFGSFFVRVLNYVYVGRRLLIGKSVPRRLVYVAAVAIFLSVCSFFIDFLRLPDKNLLNALFGDDSPSEIVGANEGFTMLLVLFGFFAIRFLLTMLSITLPLPCGLVVPLMILGATIGRVFGEILRSGFGAVVTPGSYALVGAAALASASTHAVSPCVILFEATGQQGQLLPVLLSTLAAHAVARSNILSVYDVLGALSGLPSLSRALGSNAYADRCAEHVMRPLPPLAESTRQATLPVLSSVCTVRQIREVLRATNPNVEAVGASLRSSRSGDGDSADAAVVRLLQVPLVSSHSEMKLLGSVSREALEKAVLLASQRWLPPIEGQVEESEFYAGDGDSRSRAIDPAAAGATGVSGSGIDLSGNALSPDRVPLAAGAEDSRGYTDLEPIAEDGEGTRVGGPYGRPRRLSLATLHRLRQIKYGKLYAPPKLSLTQKVRKYVNERWQDLRIFVDEYLSSVLTVEQVTADLSTRDRGSYGPDFGGISSDYEPGDDRVVIFDKLEPEFVAMQMRNYSIYAILQDPENSGYTNVAGRVDALSTAHRDVLDSQLPPLYVDVDPSPFALPLNTPLERLHLYFIMLLLPHVWVVTPQKDLFGQAIEDDVSNLPKNHPFLRTKASLQRGKSQRMQTPAGTDRATQEDTSASQLVSNPYTGDSESVTVTISDDDRVGTSGVHNAAGNSSLHNVDLDSNDDALVNLHKELWKPYPLADSDRFFILSGVVLQSDFCSPATF